MTASIEMGSVEQTVAVLAATLSADLAQRKAAEDYLTQFSYAKGHVAGAYTRSHFRST